ncbi:hypothetical protein ACFLU5_12135 [Bacteroidota bacterium]
MDEIYDEEIWSNLEYFYRVHESVTTFGADPGKNEPISHTEEFKGDDLRKCREDAYKYYYERLLGLEEKGEYFLPFAAYKDFEKGKNAAYSIELSLVEYYPKAGEELEHPLLGGDEEEELAHSRDVEAEVFKEMYGEEP